MDIVRKLARETALEYMESDIRPGALATSETLNRFRRTIEDNVSNLSDMVQQYGSEVRLVQQWIAQMTTWMLGFVNGANAQLAGYASGWEYRLADPFVSTGWSFSEPSMHDTVFGQITPPVASNVSVINPKKLVYISPSNTLPTPVARGEMEIDLTVTMSDRDWNYPTVLPDVDRNYLWLYCPLDAGYNYANNLTIALLPWSGVQVEQIWVMSGNSWTKVYQVSSALAAGRFWWDVQTTGKPQAIGVVLRKLQPLPVALVHFSPNATTFKESGTVTFDAAAAFGYAFSIQQYQVAITFPSSGGQITTSLSGAGNTILNMTVKRLSPYVPTVVSGIQLKRA